jgi:cyd operon protein YbgT
MWYFTWILGVLLAVSLGVINVMWMEAEQWHGDSHDDE